MRLSKLFAPVVVLTLALVPAVVTAAPPGARVDASATAARRGDVSCVTARLTIQGKPVAGVPVVVFVTVNGGNSRQIGTAFADGNGYARFYYRVPTDPNADNILAQIVTGGDPNRFPNRLKMERIPVGPR